MNQPVAVRAAMAADQAAWATLWRGYLAFYKTELPASTYATTWRKTWFRAPPRKPVQVLGACGI